MEDETTVVNSEERLADLPLQTENLAFARAEMLTCERCGRATPPTRTDCLYCGARLEISDAQSKSLKPNMRPLELWENGFNLILSPTSANFDDAQIQKAAALLHLSPEILRRITDARKFLPIARVAAKVEAESVQKNLREAARVETKIVADEDLNQKNPPRRLRAMDFSDEKIVFILFSGDETVEIDAADLVLTVTGAIFERRIAGLEARGKSGENKLLESNETWLDEILIDIYSRDDSIGFRVEQQGFDFSCLGAEKTLLVAQNLRFLVKQLQERAPDAKVVEDYLQVRAQLAAVWAVEEQTDSRGLKRDRFAKFNRENLTTISNAAQFLKYSRLQRQLL